jgi:hypothetical protein
MTMTEFIALCPVCVPSVLYEAQICIWLGCFVYLSISELRSGWQLRCCILVLYTNSFSVFFFFEEIHIGVRHTITFNQVPRIHMASENEFLNIYNPLIVYLRH